MNKHPGIHVPWGDDTGFWNISANNPYFSGLTERSPQESFFYVDDGGQLMALRFGDWKPISSAGISTAP